MALQYSIIKERYEILKKEQCKLIYENNKLKKEIKEKDKINDIFCNYYAKTTEELIKSNKKAKQYKEVIYKAINNSQYWIDYYTRLNGDERIALRLQENIDILKEVK